VLFYWYEKIFMTKTRKIDLYLDGALPEAERERFEQRCLEDKKLFALLQERVEWREKVVHLLQQKGAEKPASSSSGWSRYSPFGTGKRMAWGYGLAAAAALCVGLLFLMPGGRESLEVNAELEKALGHRLLRGETVEVLSPQLSQKVGQDPLFSWRTRQAGAFEVILLDHMGVEIAAYQTEDNSLLCDSPLAPGLYYWKLLMNEDWIYTGKFIVEKP